MVVAGRLLHARAIILIRYFQPFNKPVMHSVRTVSARANEIDARREKHQSAKGDASLHRIERGVRVMGITKLRSDMAKKRCSTSIPAAVNS